MRLEAYSNGFRQPEGEVASLMDSFNHADVSAILPWQDKLNDIVKVQQLLDVIDAHSDLSRIFSAFSNGLSTEAEKMLLDAAEEAKSCGDLSGFGRNMRIYYALAHLAEEEKRQYYTDLCYDAIRNNILDAALQHVKYDESLTACKSDVKIQLPLRVNWGGGWSDTPPYCLEHGGTVLNAAVLLDGRFPAEATVKKISAPKIILASGDSGAYQEFTDVADLQDVDNPLDPFALHKAALIACGIIPRE
jgi:fucokinase